MRRLRFLVSRRWLAFALVVVALAWGAWRLGEWQFSRLEDRRDRNATIERNERAGAAPVGDVMGVDEPVPGSEEWRVVEATGTYAVEDTVIVRYRTRDGASGVDVVVPLELDDGTSLLVDRGWYPTGNSGVAAPDVPEPPAGEVTVTGRVRRDATGDSASVTDQSTRAISSVEIGEALDRQVLSGFVDLVSESPEPTEPLELAEEPELDDGPHFFYGLQWWFFGALAIFGFCYLVWDEMRGGRGPWGRRPEDGEPGASEGAGPDPSERAEQPAVDREHHAGQE